MKIKVHFEYDEIYDNVEKIIPSTKGWQQLEIFYKDGLCSIPNYQVTCIEVLDDEENH